MKDELTLSPDKKELNLKLRLKDVSNELGVKMKDIADAVGVSNTYISRISSGNVTPNVKMIQKIADYLEVPVQRLIETPEGYAHFYDSHNVWQGIRKLN